MRSLAPFSLIIALLVGGASASAPRSDKEVFYCGGETSIAEVALYFERLETALAESGPRNRFNQFVADRFGVTDASGRVLWFTLNDFGSITPGRITLEEWQHIKDRGPARLEDAGWRGCFMDHGKVWFEADEKAGFKLRSINRDMDWADAHGG